MLADIRTVLLVALVASISSRPACAADRVKFDFNWRFQLVGSAGAPNNRSSATCNSTSFNPTAGTCSGLTASSATTPAACLKACCEMLDGSCRSWQFTSDPEATNSRSACWIGTCGGPQHDHSGWVGGTKPGGERPDPEGPPPPPTPATSGPASESFDDSTWRQINVPHDYLISLPYSPMNAFKNGFLPRADAYYRKHFALPARWAQDAVQGTGHTFRLVFEGVYLVATVFINGHYVLTHGDSSAAYTSFVVPLSTAQGLKLDGPNVIALHIDGSYGTEHWYSGAGIYRHVWLERTPPVHVADNGVFAVVELVGEDYVVGTVTARVELANEAETSSSSIMICATLYDPSGRLVSNSTKVAEPLPAKTALHEVKLDPIHVERPQLWTIRTPSLYTLVTTIAAAGSADVETANSTLGFRELAWNHMNGLSVNGERVKIRGFWYESVLSGLMLLPFRLHLCALKPVFVNCSHHNDFSGVGMAVP